MPHLSYACTPCQACQPRDVGLAKQHADQYMLESPGAFKKGLLHAIALQTSKSLLKCTGEANC